MTDTTSESPRDDSAWPHGAVPVSLLVGVAALGTSVFLAARHPHPLLVVSALIGGLGVTVVLMVTGFRLWFAANPFPGGD
jgi:hypothetical protein